VFLASALAAVAAPAAGAAVSVRVQGSELLIAGTSENEEFGVGFDAASGTLKTRATDIAAGAGCVANIPAAVMNGVSFPAGATCTVPGATAVRADLGDGNDLFVSGTAMPNVGDEMTIPMFVNGGSGNDRIVTSGGNDVIDSGPGDDTPDGSLGDDQITGGPGDDQISDNLGNDVIVGGGDPRDFIYALPSADGADRWDGGIAVYLRRVNGVNLSIDGRANDGEFGEGDNLGPGIFRIIGGDGSDVITGGPRADIIEGRLGDNRIDGRGGADILIADRNRGFVKIPPPGRDVPTGVVPGRRANRLLGGSGADRLFGDAGPDKLNGGSGPDILTGLGGADILIGGGGADRLVAGDGPDQLFAADGFVDFLSCGRGRDNVRSADRGRRIDRLDRLARNRCELGTKGLR
jgi:Ca2+-binding RTX toxin-like protein